MKYYLRILFIYDIDFLLLRMRLLNQGSDSKYSIERNDNIFVNKYDYKSIHMNIYIKNSLIMKLMIIKEY